MSTNSYLVAEYKKQPASFSKGGVSFLLPLSWEAFQAFKQEKALSPAEQQTALEAYYQHPYHTALRYLSKPNEWMSPEASYVYVLEEDNTQRYSTFEGYFPLIAYLWLAASDEQEVSREGYTVESRKALFVKALALIGRAHNWDRARFNQHTQSEEEYDDLEGDKPSCFSGVNRRLFQSVLDHRLFRRLTVDNFQLELRTFIRTFYQSYFENLDQTAFQSLYDFLRKDNTEPKFLSRNLL